MLNKESTPKSSRLTGIGSTSSRWRSGRARRPVGRARSPDEIAALGGAMGLDLTRADQMIENVVGLYALPLGIAANFTVNGRDVLVPMVVEEPSVVAGASFAAKLARPAVASRLCTTPPEMIGQIAGARCGGPLVGPFRSWRPASELLALADDTDPVSWGWAAVRAIWRSGSLPHTPAGPMVVVHLIFDCRDAMGANAVNTACEALAPRVEALTGGRVLPAHPVQPGRSTAGPRALQRARRTTLAFDGFSGEQVAPGIVEAWAFADVDPYRAATHNKGIMNGIDAVVVATGNDWRAIEAGAHAYAARGGRYTGPEHVGARRDWAT